MRSKIQIQEEKRRWSDWSECSASCTKRRHRKNCDDIVFSVASASSRALHLHNTTRRVRSLVGGKLEGDELPKSKTVANTDDDNLDNEDYNDDDDESDTGAETGLASTGKPNANDADAPADAENDSCENLDASLTTEEVACTGGECAKPAPAPTAVGGTAHSKHRNPSGPRLRPIVNSTATGAVRTRARPRERPAGNGGRALLEQRPFSGKCLSGVHMRRN